MNSLLNLITPPVMTFFNAYGSKEESVEEWKNTQYTTSQSESDKKNPDLFPTGLRKEYQYLETRLTYFENSDITWTQRFYYGIIAALVTAAFAALILSLGVAFGAAITVTAKITVAASSFVGVAYTFDTIKQMWNLALFRKVLHKDSILIARGG